MKDKIVLFGVDNSGKTTLAKQLGYLYDANFGKTFVTIPLGPANLDEQINFMKTHLNSNVHTIFDRFPILEEMVCGNVLRGFSNFDALSDEQCDMYFDRINCFILCYPGILKVTEWGERDQMQGVKENVLMLINTYNALAFSLLQNGKNLIEYDYTRDTPEDVFNKINEMLGRNLK